jgi:hypothetical protein
MIIHSHLAYQPSLFTTRDTPFSALESPTRLFAGDPRPAFLFNPIIYIFECPDCHGRFLGTPILNPPTCPDCLGTLSEVGTWDTRFEAWPQRQGGE